MRGLRAFIPASRLGSVFNSPGSLELWSPLAPGVEASFPRARLRD